MMSSTAADPEVWIRLVVSSSSSIQIMLDQKDDPELDDEWLTANEQLTRLSKAREKIIGLVKGSESTSAQGPQYSEEDLVVGGRAPSSTERPSVREHPLVKHRTAILVLIAKKYRSQWKMYVQKGPKTNMLHLRA